MASKRKASVLLHKETIPATPTTSTDTSNVLGSGSGNGGVAGTCSGLGDIASSLSGGAVSESEAYAGLMKDADKLKLMLLAWNYQNSTAVRNGTEGPDLSVVGGLWAQYQNALAQNAAAVAAASVKIDSSLSPVPRNESQSPMEAQDETNSSGQKEEDEVSEDDSDDKLDEKLATTHDPERLKAFNMFVRLFVDENLDRIIPISKQPKEKIQAIIDSCARQFPEFSDRSRKRIRTYLKSCRRNKKTRDGWENTSRPTPAHLTSVQAEQILAIACENESMNAKRMRIGLEPITHAVPAPGSAVAAATAALSGTNTTSASNVASVTCTATDPGGLTSVTASTLPFVSAVGFARSTPNSEHADTPFGGAATIAGSGSAGGNSTGGAAGGGTGGMGSARSSPLALSSNASVGGTSVTGLTLANGPGALNGAGLSSSSPYTPDFNSPSTTSPFVAAAAAAAVAAGRAPSYPSYFPGVAGLGNVTPTDLSMKPTGLVSGNVINVSGNSNTNVVSAQLSAANLATLSNVNNNNTLVTATQQLQQLQQQQQQQQHQQSQQLLSTSNDANCSRVQPILAHKLSPNEVTAARQVISAYRESAAFLLRTADQVEQLLVQQQ